jgi:uncharacterized protein YciI
MRRVLAVALLTLAWPGGAAGAADAGGTPPNMTTYYFGILVRGPNWTPGETPELVALQKAHIAHLTDMWKAGKLVVAGPLMDDTEWRGILIYRTKTLEEAQKLADDDPAVRAGRLQVTMHPWLVERGILPDPLESGPPKTK